MKTLLLNMVIVFVVFATTGMALAGPHGNSGASHPQNSYRAATPVLPKPVSSAATYNGGSYHRAGQPVPGELLRRRLLLRP